MDETIQRSIDRNFERILRDGRGGAYVGHEDWLREGQGRARQGFLPGRHGRVPRHGGSGRPRHYEDVPMSNPIKDAIERNYRRILHGERGGQYEGHEDDLRKGLRLLAENSLSFGDTSEQIAAGLDSADPAAPGMALLYY